MYRTYQKCWFVLFIFLEFIFSTKLVAQDAVTKAHLYFEHFNTRNGLSSNETYFVHQDRKQFIWICSDNGLNRTDGKEIKKYNTEDGLCSSILFGCKPDEKGRLWFYSFSGELSVYNFETDDFECPAFNEELKNVLKGAVITNLSFDADTFYVMFPGGYLKCFPQRDKYIFEKIKADEGELIIRQLTNNQLAYGCRRMNQSIHKITYIHEGQTFGYDVLLDESTYPLSRVTAVYSDAIYFMAGGWLGILNKENELTIKALPFQSTLALTPYLKGVLAGSYGQGLWSIQHKETDVSFLQLADGLNISNILLDAHQGIWASSHEYGAFYFPSQHIYSFQMGSNFKATKISTLLAGKDRLVYGTYDGEVGQVVLNDGSIQKEVLYNNPLEIMKLDLIEPYIIFNQGGAYYAFDMERKKKQPEPVESYLPNYTWSGVKNNFSNVHNTWKINSDDSQEINPASLKNWSYGRIRKSLFTQSAIYCSTVNSLYYINPHDESIVDLAKKYQIKGLDVQMIYPYNRDTVFVATKTHGPWLLYRDSLIKSYSIQDGLSSNCCFGLCSSGIKNRLWVGTDQGLDEVNHFLTNEPAVFSVTRKLGFRIKPVSHLALFQNLIVIGTDNGLYFIDTATINEPVINYNMEISKISVNGKPVKDLGAKASFSYLENNLEIGYHTINFRNSEERRYRSRLTSERDSTWVFSSETSSRFNALTPGDYKFEVQTQNSHGQWINYPEVSFTFSVLPPFWKSSFFVILLFFLFGSLFIVIYRIRIRNIRKLSHLQLQLVESKFKALGHQLNPHFVFNVLNSVSSRLIKMEPRNSMIYLGRLAKLMRQVFRNSQDSMIPLEQELDAVRQYLELESIRRQESLEYNILIAQDVDPKQCYIPSLILQPFIENALKYGISSNDKGGQIIIQNELRAGRLCISITDNGRGINQTEGIKFDSLEKHSINLIHERLQLLEAFLNSNITLEIKDLSETGRKGTEVKINIPVLNHDQVKTIS